MLLFSVTIIVLALNALLCLYGLLLIFNYFYTFWIIPLVGIYMILISLISSVAVWSKKVPLFYLLLVLVIFLMILQLYTTVFETDVFKSRTRERIRRRVFGYYNARKENEDMTDIEVEFDCCGPDHFWRWVKDTEQVPGSCCSLKVEDKCNATTLFNMKKPGCIDVIYDKEIQKISELPYIFLSTSIVEFLTTYVTGIVIFYNACLKYKKTPEGEVAAAVEEEYYYEEGEYEEGEYEEEEEMI